MNGAILGKIIIKGRIELRTGLHVGAQRETAEIGGVDNPIIKDPVTGMPYIPGSSLKGKLRSLFEKVKHGEDSSKYPYNKTIGEVRGRKLKMHACNTYDDAISCEICRLFGSSGDSNFPSRVIVEDAFLTEEWKNKWEAGEEIVEVKYETAIDRITSAANPRPMERVSPGTEFEFRIIYNIEDENTKESDLKNLFSTMKLLEDDYLGGAGSRGYGRVSFVIEKITERGRDFYFGDKNAERELLSQEKTIQEVIDDFDNIFRRST